MKLKFKAIKNQTIIQKIGRILLFGLMIFLLYYQLESFNWKGASQVNVVSLFPIIFALFLVIANWYFEWIKYRVSMRSIHNFSDLVLWKGFYAGMLSGFVTPSALGNFIGRMTSVNKEWKSKVVANTLVGNGAQFFVSILFGLLSLFLVGMFPSEMNVLYVKLGLVIIVFVLLMVYFTIGINGFLEGFIRKYFPSVSSVIIKIRFQFLLFSLLRYLVFSAQFFLVIKAFQPEIGIEVLFWIWQMYLWTTLSPSLFLGKLFIRETLAIFILSFAGIDLPVALLTSVIVWLMNNALPSLFAYFKWKQYVLVQA